MRKFSSTAAVALFIGLTQAAIAQSCDPGWSPVGSGSPNYPILSLLAFNDGSGPALYAGSSGGAAPIRRWDGATWSAVGSNVLGDVSALAVFNDGAGPTLYAAGRFSLAGPGSPIHAIARWNGSVWEVPGGGLPSASGALRAHSLAVFNDGTGAALYVGGYFTSAGGVPACGLARWNGQQWSAVVQECLSDVTVVKAITAPGLTGLYVGGFFSQIGGVAAANLARWDGVTWSAVGPVPPNYFAYAIQQFDDGSGPAIFTAGNNGVRKCVGNQSTPYPPTFNALNVNVLEVFDDGTGPALFAAGRAGSPQPSQWHGIAKLKPTMWSPLHGGISGSGIYVNEAFALLAADLGAGPSLYVGGAIPFAGNVVANNIARWGCGPCYSNCDNSTTAPLLNVNDFICFQNRFAASDAYANCDHSTIAPALNVTDFICFMNKAAAGCP